MAAYKDLRVLFNDSDLLERTETAIIIAANNLPANIANNAWIAQAFASPNAEAKKALMGVIAANSAQTIAAIQAADDATLQTNVDSVVATLVSAMAGV